MAIDQFFACISDTYDVEVHNSISPGSTFQLDTRILELIVAAGISNARGHGHPWRSPWICVRIDDGLRAQPGGAEESETFVMEVSDKRQAPNMADTAGQWHALKRLLWPTSQASGTL